MDVVPQSKVKRNLPRKDLYTSFCLKEWIINCYVKKCLKELKEIVCFEL